MCIGSLLYFGVRNNSFEPHLRHEIEQETLIPRDLHVCPGSKQHFVVVGGKISKAKRAYSDIREPGN